VGVKCDGIVIVHTDGRVIGFSPTLAKTGPALPPMAQLLIPRPRGAGLAMQQASYRVPVGAVIFRERRRQAPLWFFRSKGGNPPRPSRRRSNASSDAAVHPSVRKKERAFRSNPQIQQTRLSNEK